MEKSLALKNSQAQVIISPKSDDLLYKYIPILLITFYGLSLTGQYGLTKLPSPINSDVYQEICPVMSYDESTLFFTRTGSPDFNKTLIEKGRDISRELEGNDYLRKLSEIYSKISGTFVANAVKSDFNQDVWMATMGEKIRVYHPAAPLNNALPNSICSNYSRKNEYVVINEYPIDGGLKAGFSYVKRMDNGRFSIPLPIKIKEFSKKGAAINLSMSNDGQHIYLAMDSRDGYGDQDIYLCIKVFENLYSPPVNLGKAVNSQYREATPFISQDKNRLYFASNRPGGYGGMDIYYCERLDYSYRNWSEPKLLDQPINSSADDSHPYVFLDENTIMFSTNRDGTSDIYQAKMYRDDLLDKPIAVNLNIRNQEGKLKPGELYWYEAYTEKNQGFFRTNTGQYRYIIEDNIPIIFYARQRGTYSEKPMVDPQVLKNEGIHEITLDLVLPDKKFAISQTQVAEDSRKESRKGDLDLLLPLEVNKTIVLRNIYFVKSKPEVLEVSHLALRKLAEVLKKRPHVQIQIEGHTDNVGNKKELMDLSWARAEAIKKFLVNEGVLSDNILTLGFGDEKPLNNNATEKARKENRRVEIRVLKQ